MSDRFRGRRSRWPAAAVALGLCACEGGVLPNAAGAPEDEAGVPRDADAGGADAGGSEARSDAAARPLPIPGAACAITPERVRITEVDVGSALECGGRTIAVLGTPLSEAYPKENASLQERIARDFLVISQVPVERHRKQIWKHNPYPRQLFQAGRSRLAESVCGEGSRSSRTI